MTQASFAAVKALFFDVFGTLVDWRSGIAREAKTVLEPLGHKADWLAFADAWRDEYQPGMEEVRTGRTSHAVVRGAGRTGCRTAGTRNPRRLPASRNRSG